MLNILSDRLGSLGEGKPSDPLERTAKKLQEAGESALAQISQDQVRLKYYRTLGIRPMTVEEFNKIIKRLIEKEYGVSKGPSINALQELESLARRAWAAGYPLRHPEVQEKFLHFLMSYVCDGFLGKDTTGTVVGNFKGEWRGGGFTP